MNEPTNVRASNEQLHMIRSLSVRVRDVIQIAPDDAVKEPFWGKFAIVDEVCGWGVKAHIETFQGDARLRLAWEQFEVIGPAAFVREPVEG